MDINQPSVDQIVRLLESDRKRDIYEIGDQKGRGVNEFTISYPEGGKMPRFSRAIAMNSKKSRQFRRAIPHIRRKPVFFSGFNTVSK